MTLLLRKDRPWLVGGCVAATIALGAALHEHTGVRVFVVGADRLEGAFHAAWITGVVLGAVAACFDEVLGTRELLRHRPLSSAALIAARLRALLLVLACSFVLAPLGAWLGFAAFHEGLGETRLVAVLAILASYVVALSGAGIGVAAGSLPAPWWQRLLVAAAWFIASFALIDAFARGDRGLMRMGAFVGAHVLAAAMFFAVAALAARHAADADRPWPQSLRVAVGVPVAMALAVLWAANCSETGEHEVAVLQRAYPTVLKQEGGTYLLISGADLDGFFVVDQDHRLTGALVPLQQPGTELRHPERGWRWSSFGFDAPVWNRGHEQAAAAGACVLLAADGRAWLRTWRTGMHPTGRGAELLPFAAASAIGEVGGAIVVVDAAAGTAWRYDGEREHFVAIAAPAGERCEGIAYLSPVDGDPGDAELAAKIGSEDGSAHPEFVVGRCDGYTVRDGALVAVPGLLTRARKASAPAEVPEQDPIAIDVALPDDGSPVVFRHEFRPRTAQEWLHATLAMWMSVMRSPVLQLTGHVTHMPHDGAWLFDRVVANGRRPWLVLAGFVLAAACAFAFARRLRRLGANGAAIRLWAVAIVLLGLPALLVAWVVERPRAYARRDVASPAAPYLVTRRVEEVLA